ncbi:DNA-binding protein [Citrobacter freundii]|nr:DNA-binding protein [Citrobacter freundii]WFZ86690.1 DNA-binding protein [Citrobacter freundii]
MSMLFNFRPLVINPELATRIGLNEAIVLQQVNYWINDKEQGVIHSGRRWVFNSYESWVKQFPFWSADTVKRAFTSLVKQGCLDVEQLNKSQHDRTNYYTINHDCELLNDVEQVPSSNGASCPDRQAQDAPMEEGKNARSLMVTTTKTTTEIKNTLGASAGAATPTAISGSGKSSEKTSDTKPAVRQEYSLDFELVWQEYPKRAGGNPKGAAFKHWKARLAEGATPQAILDGVRRYAAFIRATGKLGTEYVKQAATFFGPDRHFEEPWTPPAAPNASGGGRNVLMPGDYRTQNYGDANPDFLR